MKNLNANEVQQACDEQTKNETIYYSGAFGYLAGLCPRCKQPIGFNLVNGGKLSPSRTLRLEHVFSGDIHCELPRVNDLLDGLSGQEKSDFFAHRHDQETIKDLSEDYRKETINRIWPVEKMTEGAKRAARLGGYLPAL